MMVALASRSWGWAPRVVGWWLALGLQIAYATDLQERVCPFPAGSAKFWLFGELDGSVEAPAHFLSMVKAALRNPLFRLGVDGRSSRAMVQMLAGLRLLQLRGWAVQVRGLIVHLFTTCATGPCPGAIAPCTPTPVGTPMAVQFADLQGQVVRQASRHPRYTALQAAFPAIQIYCGVAVLGGATPSEVTSATPQPKENP